MKKLFTTLLTLSLITLASCGDDYKEEKDKKYHDIERFEGLTHYRQCATLINNDNNDYTDCINAVAYYKLQNPYPRHNRR